MSGDGHTRASWRERYQYRFDNVMARGTIAVMGLLGLASMVFIVVVALVIVLLGALTPHQPGDDALNFFEVLWGNLMRTLDPGTMADDQGWPFRAAMLVVTVGGLIMVASLIGIISGAFDGKVDELRKGRSRVIENEHTLILGWSSKVTSIVAQLCIANESRRRPAIVILADRDKVELEDELRAQLPRRHKTRIIVRSGDPMDLGDLELGSPYTARSIILISPEDGDDSDAVSLKMALALTNNPRRPHRQLKIVGELRQPRNLEIATIVGRDEVHWVLARDLISRITVQACRQSGLSGVYTELLAFEGNEIYFTVESSLVGRSYFEAQLAYAASAVIGVVTGGETLLNPRHDLAIEAGDQLIVIAEDDRTISVGPPGVPNDAAISDRATPAPRPERILVLGHNCDLAAVLREINEYVYERSTVTVVADVPAPEFADLNNVATEFIRGDTTSRAVLDSLVVTGFDHIIVLAYREILDSQRADARTLVTLLQLREIAEREGSVLNIVSEMLDDRNREIAEVTRADDFIVSDRIISLTLAQLSENRMLTQVFDTLFSSTGCEIYLKPADLYVSPGTSVEFYTVLEAARRRGETAIGFRLAAHIHDAERNNGITLNPTKTERISYGLDDTIIVLAAG